MDKVIKINSRQGGPFTKTNNLLDFDIQPDGTYDMTDSFVNLVANITDIEEGNTPGADPTTTPAVYNNCLFWDDDGQIKADGQTQLDAVYNVALVKNSSWTTELQGAIEDIRHVDILRQNLNEYTLSNDQKQSVEYKSIRERVTRDYQLYSVFAELHCEGSIPSRKRQVKIPIKMSQLFEMGRSTQYPASSMGKTRIHCELNLNRFAVFDSGDLLTFLAAGRGVMGAVTSAGGLVVEKLTSTAAYNRKEDSPFYVTQKLNVKWDDDTEAAAPAALAAAQDVTASSAKDFTLTADLKLPTGTSRQVKITSTGDVSNRTFTITGSDPSGKAQTATVESVPSAGNKDTTEYFSEITKISVSDTGSGAAQVSAGWAAGSKRSADRVVTTIAFGAKPAGNVTLSFDKPLMTLANGKKMTNVEVAAVSSGVLQADGTSLGVGNLQIESAELVLRRLANPPKPPSQLNYMSYTTEEFTGNGQTNFQRMFQLEPEAVNIFMMFPQFDLLSRNKDLLSFRLRLNNEDLTDREIRVDQAKPKDPLHYDRLAMTLLNAGYPLRCALENNVTSLTPPDGGMQSLDNPMTMIANPVPATPMEKLLQVNMDVSGKVTNGAQGSGLLSLVLFKQVMRSIKL